MALKKCKECGAEISSKAKVCPSCGAKNKTRSKLGVFLAVILIGIGLIWMISDGVSAGSSSSGSSTITAKVNETVTTDDFEITVTSIKKLKKVGNEYFNSEPASGGIYVAIQYTYKNISNEPMTMWDTPDFYLYDSNDVKYKTDSGASGFYATELELNEKVLSELNPGISANGADVFEVSAERIEEGAWKLKVVADKSIYIDVE
ncbi:MAG: DUF4352 domain-containing protein [Spirochaetota bacterium]|nr:DUF4352 domain-containing protein [Spirochaetota bacterium]